MGLDVDWSVFAAAAPLGLLGFAVTGVAASIAIKANGGLVRVAERLTEALAGISGGQPLPKVEQGKRDDGSASAPSPVQQAESPDEGSAEPQPEVSDEEFPPHERMSP